MKTNQIKKFKLFKPVIASSLALTLGCGNAYANDGYLDYTQTDPQTSPVTSLILYKDKTEFPYDANCKINHHNCISDLKKDFSFIFGKRKEYTQIDLYFNTIIFQEQMSTANLNILGKGKVFDFSDHTMTIDFYEMKNKTFNFTAEREFKGNITIYGSGDNNKFDGTFEQGVTGTIKIGTADNLSRVNTTLVFGDTSAKANARSSSKQFKTDIMVNAASNAKNSFIYKEDTTTQKIWTIQGVSETIFEKNATMQSGNEVIYTGWWQNNKGAAKATFTFKGMQSLIKNTKENSQGIAVQANANQSGKTAENILNFQGNDSTNTIEGKIIATANRTLGDSKGSNTITFSNQTKTNAIKGNILTEGNYNSKNNITFNGKISNTITGNINTSAGTATITFKSDTTNTNPVHRIIGDITTTGVKQSNFVGNSQTNIQISSKANSTNTSEDLKNLSFFAGNITTDGHKSNTNIIFENSIWLPNYIATTDMKKVTSGNLPEIPSGTLINRNNGATNIVLRTSNAVLNTLGTSMFNIINAGDQSKVNVVIQGSVNVGANITYGGRFDGGNYIWDGKDNANQTTFIFANGNNINFGGNESFTNSTDTTNTNNKVLGVTYQDGIKLTLKDKTIKNSNGENISFLNTYKNYFISKETDPILTLTTNRTNNGAFKDTIVIEGLLVGDVVALERSNANKDKHAEFDVTLKTNSAFFGGFDFSNLLKTQNGANPLDKTSITLVMEKGSKFFIDSSVTLQNLSIKNVDLNREETLVNTFAQSNTVIDLGSYGNDNNALRKGREDFNLLSIGVVSNMQPQSTEATTGLEGENALFRVYANANAKQETATLGKVKAKNGSAESGTYGHVYSDRIIVDNAKTNDSSSGTNNSLQEYIQVLYDANTDAKSLSHAKGTGTETAGNIAVFTVKNNESDKALVDLKPADVLQGFDVIGTTLVTETTDRNGKVSAMRDADSTNGYTTYFVDKVGSKGASESIQSA
ncbi:hypothetical protein LW133_06920, partial [Helicobacter sp. faydin-H8]|nr:hypothetical protein [Helicobacter anatolicus]